MKQELNFFLASIFLPRADGLKHGTEYLQMEFLPFCHGGRRQSRLLLGYEKEGKRAASLCTEEMQKESNKSRFCLPKRIAKAACQSKI